MPETTTTAEPMQLGFTHITAEELECCKQNQLCLYCGQAGHVKISCPVHPSTGSRSVSDHVTTSPSSIKLSVKIRIQDKLTTTTALIDSGAADNVVSLEFAQKHKLKLTPCNTLMAVEALDGRPLGEGRVSRITEEVKLLIGTLHSKFIKFYIIHSPNHLIILGLPWLRTHNPHIYWREGQILQWGTICQERCLSKIPKASTTPSSSTVQNATNTDLPSEYSDLADLSKKKASQLPTHRSVDFAIELMPSTTPPKGRFFPLSQPESEAMRQYIEKELAKGFIRPSTSPA